MDIRLKRHCIVNKFLALSATFLIVGSPALAQDINPPEELFVPPQREYSPFVDDNFPARPLFGDTHVHTSYSTDAGMVGTTLGQDEAYRFARGEAVTSSLGWNVKLYRPLDFLVISDHAENLGLADFIRRSDPILLANEQGKIWHDQVKAGDGYEAFIDWLNRGMATGTDLINDDRMAPAVWDRVIDNADRYNEPGTFTAFIGFEWSSAAGDSNLHRNVIFRDGEERTRQTLPFSLFDSEDPEDLWAYMSRYEESTGGRVLAIPHNGNLSNGVMFQTTTLDGRPLDQAYADMRMRFEPIYEVTQMKGDGEAHPFLSPDDEFADFETLDKGNIVGTEAKTPEMFAGEYAREALKVGLQLEDDLGTNPYKFGMIGSTDAHTGLATTREDNNFGKVSFTEPSAERAAHVLIRSQVDPALNMMVYETGASGLAAVWARENTREAIWDAMARKEVYATTGSRMTVRIFAGWDFVADEVETQNFAREGYTRGVPMGGDLSAAPDDSAPRLMIRALRDPDNANLDRVQVIKGWLDSAGETHERIWDVACSDDRAIVDRRCEREVGSTVDLSGPGYTNTIGDPLLTAFWEDPEFDPTQSAFYYVRVIEIPKPRWTAYDAAFFDVEMSDDIPMTVQDRAYTSPIWYTP